MNFSGEVYTQNCRPDVIVDQTDQIFEINKRPECNKGDQVGQIVKN